MFDTGVDSSKGSSNMFGSKPETILNNKNTVDQDEKNKQFTGVQNQLGNGDIDESENEDENQIEETKGTSVSQNYSRTMPPLLDESTMSAKDQQICDLK